MTQHALLVLGSIQQGVILISTIDTAVRAAEGHEAACHEQPTEECTYEIPLVCRPFRGSSLVEFISFGFRSNLVLLYLVYYHSLDFVHAVSKVFFARCC